MSEQRMKVGVYCPYCGEVQDADLGHRLEVVICGACKNPFVAHAVVNVEARTMKIEQPE